MPFCAHLFARRNAESESAKQPKVNRCPEPAPSKSTISHKNAQARGTQHPARAQQVSSSEEEKFNETLEIVKDYLKRKHAFQMQKLASHAKAERERLKLRIQSLEEANKKKNAPAANDLPALSRNEPISNQETTVLTDTAEIHDSMMMFDVMPIDNADTSTVVLSKATPSPASTQPALQSPHVEDENNVSLRFVEVSTTPVATAVPRMPPVCNHPMPIDDAVDITEVHTAAPRVKNEEAELIAVKERKSSSEETWCNETTRNRLVAFFSFYNKQKLRDVDRLVTKYNGMYPALFGALVKRYGPEPPKLSPSSSSATVENVEQRGAGRANTSPYNVRPLQKCFVKRIEEECPMDSNQDDAINTKFDVSMMSQGHEDAAKKSQIFSEKALSDSLHRARRLESSAPVQQLVQSKECTQLLLRCEKELRRSSASSISPVSLQSTPVPIRLLPLHQTVVDVTDVDLLNDHCDDHVLSITEALLEARKESISMSF